MFSVQDYASLADSPTGLPLAELFHQATQSRGGAFALVFLLWVAVGPCMIGSQLSMTGLPLLSYESIIQINDRTPIGTGRMLWAFARDDGLPFSKLCASKSNHVTRITDTNRIQSCSKVNKRFGAPVNAQLCVGIIIALLGCIYLGSSTAFNSMMSSSVYALPHFLQTPKTSRESFPTFLTFSPHAEQSTTSPTSFPSSQMSSLAGKPCTVVRSH